MIRRDLRAPRGREEEAAAKTRGQARWSQVVKNKGSNNEVIILRSQTWLASRHGPYLAFKVPSQQLLHC